MSVQGLIKTLMKKQGVGYAELARRTGITRQSVHRTLSGDGDLLMSKVVTMLAALGYRFEVNEMGAVAVVPGYMDEVVGNEDLRGVFYTVDPVQGLWLADKRCTPVHVQQFEALQDMVDYLRMTEDFEM